MGRPAHLALAGDETNAWTPAIVPVLAAARREAAMDDIFIVTARAICFFFEPWAGRRNEAEAE